EWVHVQLHQQKGMISLSPPTICNSANLRTQKMMPLLLLLLLQHQHLRTKLLFKNAQIIFLIWAFI
ncbi:hypothetical protein ABTJ06_11140, partial [Acinetobacter baumannii]